MLIDTIKKDNMLALKEKNNNKRAILGIAINKLMLASIELKTKGQEITPEQETSIILKTLKELDEELEGYKVQNNENKIKDINANNFNKLLFIVFSLKKIMSTLNYNIFYTFFRLSSVHTG